MLLSLCVNMCEFIPDMLFLNLSSVANNLAWIALFTPLLPYEVHMICGGSPSQQENVKGMWKGNVIDKVTAKTSFLCPHTKTPPWDSPPTQNSVENMLHLLVPFAPFGTNIYTDLCVGVCVCMHVSYSWVQGLMLIQSWKSTHDHSPPQICQRAAEYHQPKKSM